MTTPLPWCPIPVPADDSIAMTARLAPVHGLFAGTSTGANVVAALRVAKALGRGVTVVFRLADTSLKYLSTAQFTS